MKKILVPCNFSDYAERALRFALQIAEKSKGKIFVCTVLSESQSQDSILVIKEQSEQKYLDFISRFNTSDIAIEHHIHTGKITIALLEFIDIHRIDLVVMGTQGSRGWQEAFMGSNIGKIVRTSPVPVFAIKNHASVSQIRNIVMPSSMMDGDIPVLEKIKSLQDFFNAKLHLLYVNTHPRRDHQQGIQKLQAFAFAHQLQHYSIHVVHNAIEKDGILQYAREINADMIAMGTHGNRNPGNMYVSSIAADIANYAATLTWTCATENPE
jgi:nucleotide-binding universal stress UspA family protein